MSEITTAAELDALPEGTTVLDGDHDIMTKGTDGEWHLRSENDEPAPCHLPARVLVRPDRPAQPTVQPTVETLALVVHQGWQGYKCTCGLDDLGPVERETATRVAGAVLDAIRGEQ